MKALIRSVFHERPHEAVEVARLETGFRMIQSSERYRTDRPEYGLKAGEREQSYCMFQIHEPAHKKTIEQHGLQDYRTNVESCVKMARIVYDEREKRTGDGFKAWSVYTNKIVMR